MSKHQLSSFPAQSDTGRPNKYAGTILQRHPLSTFFVLAYLIAWSINVIQAGLLPFQLPLPLSDFLVNWAPGFAAIIVVAAISGLDGIRALLHPLLAWRVSPGWYSVALLLSPLLVIVAIGISLLFGGPVPQFSHSLSRTWHSYPFSCSLILVKRLAGAVLRFHAYKRCRALWELASSLG